MNRLSRLRGRTEERYGLDDLAHDITTFGFGGMQYPIQTTWGTDKAEAIGNNFIGYVNGAYKTNGPVFACILARQMLFSEARFQWQRLRDGRPGDLFGNSDLDILERPWPNGTTGDLLARLEPHASLAGNAYVARRGDRLRVMRPDWTAIVIGSPSGDPDDLDAAPAGYVYYPSGPGGRKKPVTLLPEDVAHFAPIPDPDAHYRGMSWLTPVLTEIQADGQATKHKKKFFENAATPNLTVSLDKALTVEQFREFQQAMADSHQGTENAYKTLYLGGGADVKVVGADLKQLDFKTTQGAGETRICAAAGVPPIIVGLSEGLEASTYSNYGQARRKFGDHWARPQWRSVAGALQTILPTPAATRLWYDDRDIPFLQEDQKDAADIAQTDAQSIRTLTDGGYEPQSVIKAVMARDMSLLTHTGLVPVQLQLPGMNAPQPA